MKQSKVLACKCNNSYQDKRYGAKRRVMNITTKGANSTMFDTYRCTVCETLVESQKKKTKE